MPRYKLLIEYDGTNYNGWQLQPQGKTIEGEIEAALSQVLRQEIDVVGQGRTDSGVHAEGQAAHFDFPGALEKHKLLFALLGVLPRDIAAWDLETVADDFHARFDAVSRQYRYQVVTRPSPLHERYAEMVLEDLDVESMRECAEMVVGAHDFESFTKSAEEQEKCECTVELSELARRGHLIEYRIRANRFVRHMVRRIVGTMIQVGRGKRTAEEFALLLHNPSKEVGGHGAAAKGLVLEKVSY